jgi:hypothetical protein
LTALKQLDAAVAAEVSDLENSGDAKRKSADVKVAPSINGETTSSVPAPPPPPPPPGLLHIINEIDSYHFFYSIIIPTNL